jgi:hypothetical protein
MFGPRFEPAGTSENWWNLIKSAALMKMIMMQSSLFMLLFLLNSCNRAVKWRQWRRALLAADAMLAWRTVSLWLTRWQETEAFESKVKWCIFLPRKGPVCKVCIPKKFHTLRYISASRFSNWHRLSRRVSRDMCEIHWVNKVNRDLTNFYIQKTGTH